MQKIYKVSWFERLFFPLIFLVPGIIVLLFWKILVYRFIGIIALLMSIYLFRVLNNTKITVSEEYLIVESYLSSLRYKKIQVRWSEIRKVTIASRFIGGTSYLSTIYCNNRNNMQTETKYENILAIPPFIKGYRELMTEIVKRAPHATTKR